MKNLNYQGPFGNTLLHGAAMAGDLGEVKRLLAAGANPRIRNRDGRTPLQVALLVREPRVYALLKRASSPARRTPR